MPGAIARAASAEIADRLLREIAEAGEQLAAKALLWRSRDELKTGLRSVLAHLYSIFYRVTDGTVEIVRVLHERRDFAAVFSKGKR